MEKRIALWKTCAGRLLLIPFVGERGGNRCDGGKEAERRPVPPFREDMPRQHNQSVRYSVYYSAHNK